VGTTTPIHQVAALGQSIWYDNLQRSLLVSGRLQQMIDEGLLGMTSNPTIFEKAMSSGSDYDAQIATLDPKLDDVAAYEALAIKDIQGACDLFRPVYDRLAGKDGFVSLEVSPRLARDTQGTIDEAKRLFAAVARPNVMIKIPGTPECITAIQHCIGLGININTTLLFSIDSYLATAEAYQAGLEKFKADGGDLSKVAGVASFFLSRIDTAVDKLLGEANASLRGRAAVANAKIAYQKYQQIIAAPRWQALATAGARPQRLLWASTSTKNPAYSKLLYVETLIGPDTVNTVPTETYNEIMEHAEGHIADTLSKDIAGAVATIARLADAGVSMKDVTDKLLADGVTAFSKSFDTLLPVVHDKRAKLAKGG
jgi:transaldolase